MSDLNSAVGICGDPAPSAYEPDRRCTLPADHAGWHRDDDECSWSHGDVAAELEACRQELAVQVARAGAAEADRDLALVRPDAVPEIQGRLRRIAEAQVRELTDEVRRLRALVPLEQRHPKTAPTTDEAGA